jgi:hypothetical protein
MNVADLVNVAALKNLVRSEVRSELQTLGVVVRCEEYANTNLPPGVNARTFSRWCRSGRVAGAVGDGKGWRCGVEAWRAARAAGRRAPTPSPEEIDDTREAAEMVRRSRRVR